MNEKGKNRLYILMGIIFIFSGIALMFFPLTFIESISSPIAVLIAATGVSRSFQAVIRPKDDQSFRDRLMSFIVGVLQVVLAIWVWQYTEATLYWLLNFIGYYQLLMGLISLISYGILVRDQIKNRFNRLLLGLLHLVLAFFSFTANENGRNVMVILGVHAILIGLTYINDGRGNFIKVDQEKRLKRKIRFPLPIIFNALLPTRLLRKINLFIEGELDFDEEIEQHTAIKELKEDSEYTMMQILVHAGSNQFDVIGHMNIVYNNKVYSYGNHDVESRHLFDAIGDGVMVIIDKDDYIDFSIKDGNNLVVEYDVILDNEQKEALEAKLREISSWLVPWKPTTEAQPESYGGKLMRAIPEAEFYKFSKSKFKTYFVMGTNCVMLSDEIIGTSGLDLFMLVGILTPGTYYDYLEKEFRKPNSIIVSRTVHHNRLYNYLKEHSYSQ